MIVGANALARCTPAQDALTRPLTLGRDWLLLGRLASGRNNAQRNARKCQRPR